MTTIAYKDGIVAWDSRGICDNMISDDAEKHILRDGVHFWIAGITCDVDELIDAFFGDVGDDMDSYALVYDGKDLFMFGIAEGKGYKTPITDRETWAIGSGAPHALTAMDLGCSAKESIRMAAKRDYNTGGRIRTYKLRFK